MFSSTRSSFDTLFSAMCIFWRGSSRRHRRTPIRYRLRFEQLEGRTMLSGVTTQAALIAAINAANAAGGSNSVTLGANITLYETTANNTNDGPNGLPYITSGDNLTIVGNGHVIQRSTSSGDAAFRLFDVASGASLNLNNMSLENGRVSRSTAATLQGGAIFVESGGKLNLNRVTLSGNSVNNAGGASQNTLEGGAIYNAGTATIVASTVTGNSAAFSLTNAAGQGDNDAFDNDNGNGLIGDVVVEGGGIYNAGSLSITSSSLVGQNSATSAVTNGSNSPPGTSVMAAPTATPMPAAAMATTMATGSAATSPSKAAAFTTLAPLLLRTPRSWETGPAASSRTAAITAITTVKATAATTMAISTATASPATSPWRAAAFITSTR